MIHRIVDFALRQRFLIILMSVAIAIVGAVSFVQMPISAYPDLSPPMVEIITQWPGHAAEEIERLVTIPIEIEMNGIPNLEHMRSISRYGLSDVILTFSYSTGNYFCRELAFQRLSEVTLPAGVTPTLAPMSSPSDLIYRYVIQSPDRTPMQLKTIQDWVLNHAYRAVPGVADDSGFGGTVMQYQVLLDPTRLFNYHIPVTQVMNALSANNANTGGGFYSRGGQFYYVRGLGLATDTQQIGNIVVASQNGTPVYVKDVGKVVIGHAPRLGEFGYMHRNDAVEGVILMRTGEKTQYVLRRVEKETNYLNKHVLPPDVRVHPYYDRMGLINLTTDTVETNLIRGMILVLIILIIFLFSLRAAVIVAITIPLALLFAFIFLHLKGVDANLLSIGAIDFGILVEGAVMMMENIFREIAAHHGQEYKLHDVIISAASEVDRPVFYAVAVIIAGYLPIYALRGAAGRLFHPMADTMVFALVGSLIFALTLVPVLASYWFKHGIKEKVNRPYEWCKEQYRRQLKWCLNFPKLTFLIMAIIFVASLFLVPYIGAEFMPTLDEGALWVRATMPYTISWQAAAKISPQIRDVLMSFPQVTTVASELGRPDDGTDPTGFFNDEFYVGLHPYNAAVWKKGKIRNKEELTAAINAKLQTFPGIIFNYTQPAEDAVDEALTGLKSALAVKIYGPNLTVLQNKAVQVKQTLARVRGFTDLVVVRELGQPSLLITVNRAECARYGVNVSDVEAIIQAAVGGQAVSQVIEGEKEFDLLVRMEPQFRSSAKEISNLLVADPGGQQIPLSQVANIQVSNGAAFIYRQNNERYIGVQYSVHGRDLAGAVAAGQKAVNAAVPLPAGYHMTWGGEYSEYLAARKQIKVIGPLTLFLIFLILFALYGNVKFPIITALGVIMTEPVGALVALKLTHTPFSVSSALGLLALLGVAVETSVILFTYINKLRLGGMPIQDAILEASVVRLRPIAMTALVAALGLLPAALSHNIGSDTERPFAIVIVAGLISRLFLGVYLGPALYKIVARDGDVLQV